MQVVVPVSVLEVKQSAAVGYHDRVNPMMLKMNMNMFMMSKYIIKAPRMYSSGPNVYFLFLPPTTVCVLYIKSAEKMSTPIQAYTRL
mmetsp:Transcript_4752/g.12487  ORF Transcript_4752/g.12487 Transcript_4752/m.12487 type:complete len:87 (+) Transcript_4752:86-346(+)